MPDVPKRGDGVWHHEYGNGVIKDIIWYEKDVIVFFYRRYWNVPGHEETFDTSSFDSFEERFNQWMIYY